MSAGGGRRELAHSPIRKPGFGGSSSVGPYGRPGAGGYGYDGSGAVPAALMFDGDRDDERGGRPATHGGTASELCGTMQRVSLIDMFPSMQKAVIGGLWQPISWLTSRSKLTRLPSE
jgi:hypothetical protein